MGHDTEHKKRLAVERLLDSEGLTDGLEDTAAKRLLDWGLAQTERLATETADDELERSTGGIRRLIKRVNNLIADRAMLTDDEFTAEVDDLQSLAAEKLGARVQSAMAVQPLLSERGRLSEKEMVERLTALLTPPEANDGIPSDRVGIDGTRAAWAITCDLEDGQEFDWEEPET